jgi:hypothetical protein
MDERNIKEINSMKQEIFQQKENITDIKDLVKKEIDRDFTVDLWELSERELDSEMGNRLSFLNDDIDTRPEAKTITSHRRIIGRPIVLIKRLVMKIAGFYTNTILEKQRKFNEQLVAFHLASFIRFRHNEEKIKEIKKRLKILEENQELMLERLETLTDDI